MCQAPWAIAQLGNCIVLVHNLYYRGDNEPCHWASHTQQLYSCEGSVVNPDLDLKLSLHTEVLHVEHGKELSKR